MGCSKVDKPLSKGMGGRGGGREREGVRIPLP